MKTFFDINNYLSDLAAEAINSPRVRDWYGNLFTYPESLTVHSERVAGVHHNDTITVKLPGGPVRVQLTQHVYHIIHLTPEELAMRPGKFANEVMVRGMVAVDEQLAALIEGNTDLLAAMPAQLPYTVEFGGLIHLDKLTLRWFIDYDHTALTERLVIDAYVGAHTR